MPPRKDRIPVVFDTNIFITFYLSTNPESANSRVYRMWRNQRRLQLIISDEMINEYLRVLDRLGVPEPMLRNLRSRFETRSTVTWVSPVHEPAAIRDPNDNIVLATAQAGRVKYLVTSDLDLLDLPENLKSRYSFQIVTPAVLLDLLTL